jgi:hypothetical protein
MVFCKPNGFYDNDFVDCSNDQCTILQDRIFINCGEISCWSSPVNGTIRTTIASDLMEETIIFYNINACPIQAIPNPTIPPICNKTKTLTLLNTTYQTTIIPSKYVDGCNADIKYDPHTPLYSSLAKGTGHGTLYVCSTILAIDATATIYSCNPLSNCAFDMYTTNCGMYNCYLAPVFGEYIVSVTSAQPNATWITSMDACPAQLEIFPPICNYSLTTDAQVGPIYTTEIPPEQFAYGCDLSYTQNPNWSSHKRIVVEGELYICSTELDQDISASIYECNDYNCYTDLNTYVDCGLCLLL